jgi:hypothetical protein
MHVRQKIFMGIGFAHFFPYFTKNMWLKSQSLIFMITEKTLIGEDSIIK